MAPGDVVAPTTALARSDHALEVKPILDAFFAPLLAVPHRDDLRIAQLMKLVADVRTIDLGAAAAAHGIAPHALRRLSNRYFGFPPRSC